MTQQYDDEGDEGGGGGEGGTRPVNQMKGWGYEHRRGTVLYTAGT